jgi:hypothetical protein
MGCALKSLRRDCTTRATPGLKTTLTVVAINDIDVWPSLLTTSGAGDNVTLDGDIELKVDKEFYEVEIDSDTGEGDFLFEGQNGSGGWENKIMGEISGNSAAVAGFAKCINSPCGFVMLAKAKNGTIRVIGSPDEPAFFTRWNEKTGKLIKDKAHHAFEALATQADPPYYYEGTITPIAE